jgi:hypothetical protein
MEANMNAQEQMIDKRTFRIAAIAVAAVAVLVLAAYLFGTSLRADTSASVAPSPLGSSLTNSSQSVAVAPSFTGASSLDSRGARTILSAERAAAVAAADKDFAIFYNGVNATNAAAAEAARWAAMAAADTDLAIFYGGVNATNAAAAEAARWAAMAAADTDLAILYGGVNATNATADQTRSAAVAAADKDFANFYSAVNATNAAADQARPAEADPYQNEWMGFISPESVGARSPAADPYQNGWMGFTAPEFVAATLPADFHDSSADFYGKPDTSLLVTGLEGGMGSTLGPDGALYVTEPIAGSIARIDPKTGEVTTFASGLPMQLSSVGLGGVMDVAFIGHTAYALVTLVGPDVGGSDVDGIYRVDGPNSFTVVADIGQWSIDNPPPGWPVGYDVATGVQYAMQPYRGGLLVTDGHHNRVLKVGPDGSITQLIQLDDDVPTGLELWGNTIYVAQAGPLPHNPADGKIVSFEERSPTAMQVAAGAPLLVDVEFGLGRSLYGLSQGTHTNSGPAGSPADPDTGSLVKVNSDGTFTVITDGLNQPTSLEFIGNTAYVVTLSGEVWKIEGVSGPPFGAAVQSQWVKPEGVRPAAEAGADQLQWIKPEGLKIPVVK